MEMKDVLQFLYLGTAHLLACSPRAFQELPLPDDSPPLYPDEESDHDESDEEEDQDDEELSE